LNWWLLVKTIYSQHKKRRGKAAWKLFVAGKAVKNGRETPVRLIYVPNRNKKREYLVLVTTDMSLTEAEIVRNYGKRWGIDVFFKICKSYLKLSKEMSDITLTTAVELIILEFVKQIERADVMDSDKLAAMVADFIASLPSRIKQANSICQSEMLVTA